MAFPTQAFFDQFIGLTWTLRWPLAIFFVLFIGRELRQLKSYERVDTLLMFSYFFLVITSFWVLKPLKKAVFIGYHKTHPLELFGWTLDAAQAELLAKEVNMLVALLAAVLFALVSRRFRRHQLTYIVGGSIIVGFALFNFTLHDPGVYTAWAYYVFGDMYSTLMVATFFAFLNDCEEPVSARKLYGLIGFGGVSGGFFGSSIVANTTGQISPAESTWIGIGITVVILIIAAMVGHSVARHPPREWPSDEPQVSSCSRLGQAFEGARLIFRSRYFLSIVAIVTLYEITSTILDFQFTSTVLHYVPKAELSKYFSQVYSFTGFISLLVQLFLTGYVLTRFGVGAALLVLPLAVLSGSLIFFVAPVLLFGSLLNTLDNAFNYSINQSARETLYTPESRDNKYKTKAFIDIFILRFAKALAVLLSLGFSIIFSEFAHIRWLSLPVLVFLVFWFIAIRYAGRAYDIKEKAEGKIENLN
jgi:AAA family ATP:ADP antiporter